MVSVIITTHNRVNLLSRAIESVFAQTYNNYELIVVSDGSIDGTDDFMSRFEDNPQVSYITYYPGKGGNYARNSGIRVAKGEYVAFLDDDDEWLPNKLEKQVATIEKDNSIGLVYTGVNAIYVEDRVTYKTSPSSSGDLSKNILLKNLIGSTTTVLVRKQVLEKSGVFDEELFALQDYDLWIRVCQHAQVAVISEALVNYYNYRNTTQVSSSTEKYEKAFEHIEHKYNLIIDRLSLKEQKNRVSNKLFLLGNKAMRNNNPRQARMYFKKLLANGFNIKALIYYFMTFTSFSVVLRLRKFI